MNEVLNAIMPSVIELVSTILITVIGILGSKLLAKLNQTKKLDNISAATAQVIESTKDTVLELQQTTVLKWKNAQGGKLTPEQVEELKQEVLAITLSKLSDDVVSLLEGAQVDIAAQIVSASEAKVLELKGEQSK